MHAMCSCTTVSGDCANAPVVSHGIVAAGLLTDGVVRTYTCDVGYTANSPGSGSVTCTQMVWGSPTVVCAGMYILYQTPGTQEHASNIHSVCAGIYVVKVTDDLGQNKCHFVATYLILKVTMSAYK
jgi:hypothetical protein